MAIIVPIVSSWNPQGLDKAVAEIKRAEGSFNKITRTADILSASLISTGKGLIRNVTVPLAGLGIVVNKTITDASNLQEAQSKVTAVFKTQAGEVNRWAKTTSAAFGISQRQALEASGTFGNLFQAFGIGQTEARKMSVKLVELAADMASFNNVPIDEALTALRSGLSGETEPLKRFGVALNDVRLKQEAAALGLGTYTGVLPIAIKSQAAYSLILKDTALQQGDVARTAGGLANQKKFLAAQVEDLSGSFGAVLMPVMINFVGILRNSVLPQIQKFIEAFKTLSPEAVATGIKITLFAAALGPAMVMIGYFIKMLNGLADAFLFLMKRIVLIPTIILLIAAAFVKGNNATMSWGEAVFKVVRGVVIGFVQMGNAVSAAINVIIKGYNLFQKVLDSGVTIKEVGNLDFLIRGIDNAAVSYGKFSQTLSTEQSNLSAIAAEAKALGQSLGGASTGAVAGGSDKASDAISNFKTKLNDAKQVLSDAKSKFEDFAKSISGSIRSVINFGDAANAESGSFIENLMKQATKATDFATKVRQLISMGLSESALSEVLGAGADAGTKIADEIIAGGASMVNQVNTLVSSTASLAEEVGKVGAEQFYSAGVAQGNALVQGIVDAIKAAGLSIEGTNADTIASATQAATNAVASTTSKVATTAKKATNKTKKLTVPKGAKIPALAAGGIVNQPTLALIGEAGPEAVVPLNKANKMGGTYNITVNAGMGADGGSIGREIVDAIKRYERASGPVFASA